ncbi:MAG TPA: hypothetical protein VHV49_04435 [Pseudonocardiaceae bacterium]|nr:hypothetical protein [Pseudonocardiaceae bacterium]
MNSSLSALRAQVNDHHQQLIAAAERARLAKRLTTPTRTRPTAAGWLRLGLARRPNRSVALHVVR